MEASQKMQSWFPSPRRHRFVHWSFYCQFPMQCWHQFYPAIEPWFWGNIKCWNHPGSNIYVEDEKLENALLKLKISGFVPARSSEYFTQLSWGELSKSFIQEHISLANNFNWMEGRTDIYENKDTGEIKALIVDFVPSPLGS